MTARARVIDGAVEVGVVALLMFAPLPRGSVVPWAQSVIEIGVTLLLALTILRMAMSGDFEVRRTPLLWPAVAMAALAVWQVLSPSGLVSPYATQESVRLYGAYFGLLLVVNALPMTRARVARLTGALVGWAVVLAGMGFARQLGIGPKWLPENPETAGRLSSTFVNPNHQALYFSMALFVALGLLLRPHWPRERGQRSDRERARDLLEGAPARVFLLGGVLILALALALTASRGGIVSTAAGLLAMLSLALTSRTRGRVMLPILLVAFGFVTYASWVGLGAVTNRFVVMVREPASDLRVPMWAATLRMVGDAPVTGIGLGAFRDGFSPYRPVEVPAERVVDYAHNDFLQLLAESGVLGLSIAVWAFIALLTFVARRWRERRDPFVRDFLLGGVGVLVAVGVHSLVDFGLHMPANAIVLTVVAGLLPLVATLHQTGSEERVGLERWDLPLSPRWSAATVLVAVLGVTVAVWVWVPIGIAGWRLTSATDILRDAGRRNTAVTQGDLVEARRDLLKAVAWDPSNPVAWSTTADVSAQLAARAWQYGLTPTGERLRDLSVDKRLGAAQPFVAEAYEAYRLSLRLRPRAAEVHEQFGWFLGGVEAIRLALKGTTVQTPIDRRLANVLGSDQSARPEAIAHFQEAIRWDPQNAYRYKSLGLFALGGAAGPSDQQMASAALAQALGQRPDFLDPVLDELLARRVDDQFLLAAVPQRFQSLLDLGQRLDRRGRSLAAASAFERAIGLAPNPANEVEARLAYARSLIARKDSVAALEQVRRALVVAPREAEIFALLATIYGETNQGVEADMALTTAATLAESVAGPPGHRNSIREEIAGLLVQRGHWERAVALWREMLRERPNNAWAHLELGRLLAQHGQSAEALQEYRTASASAGSEDAGLYRAVARALRDGGYLREAIASYETAHRLRPTDADLGAELGDLYARIGMGDEAIRQYRQVLRYEPEHAGARRGLASVRTGAGS